MHVFVTGATGYIGSAVVRELIDAGHQVTGLTRSEASAEALTLAGATPLRGSLTDLDILAAGASAADGVVHTAFIHDFADFAAAAETDLHAVRALGAAVEGSDRPLVIASGIAGVLTPGRVSDETDPADPLAGPRAATEQELLAMSDRGVRASAVRLPPTVHGAGDHGFVHALATTAREHGVSAYIGDGANRWPAVHRLDAARLFRLALENAPAGSRLHAVAEEGIPFRLIAEALGRQLDIEVSSVSAEDAAEHLGWIGYVAGLDNPAKSEITRGLVGWQPERPTVLDDIDAGLYSH
jgi:nucleoside-diphosphate-sugar epimerase